MLTIFVHQVKIKLRVLMIFHFLLAGKVLLLPPKSAKKARDKSIAQPFIDYASVPV